MYLADLDELHLKNGGRRDFWLAHAALVERFIEAHGKELTRVQLPAQPRAAAMEAAAPANVAAARTLMWDPTRGGMRMPHLHYAGEVYVLNEAQWAELSKSAVSALAERMSKAGRVGFESVMQLSDAVAAM